MIVLKFLIFLCFRKIIKLREKAKKPSQYNWLRDDPLSSRRIRFNLAQYHSYDEISSYLDHLNAAYPDRTKVRTIGLTHERRPIKLIKVN